MTNNNGNCLRAQVDPAPITLDVERIPPELKARPQWVVWKKERRGKADKKPTKVLYQVLKRWAKAQTNAPATWAGFDEAVACYRCGGFDGIGYVYSPDDDYFGVDLDNCLDDEGNVLSWAVEFFEKLRPTYAEISPSGRGVKFTGIGKLPGPTGTKVEGLGPDGTGGVEIYEHGRYFTFTGNIFGEREEIAEIQGVAESIYKFCNDTREARRAQPKKDNSLIRRATNGPTVEERALKYLAKCDPAIEGQGGHNTTFGVACRIGPGFDLAPDVAYRILAEHYNPRCQPEWDERDLRRKVDEAYRVETNRGWLRDADSNRSSEAKAPMHGAQKPSANGDEIDWDSISDEDMGILSGDKIDPKPVEWLWPNRIAKRKMNIVAGEGKQGKTQMVLAIAAATTVGGELPDGSGRVTKGTVIILSAEDDPEDILAPRLIALGADMSKIKIIRSDFIIRRKGKPPEINPIDFQRIDYWRALFKRFPDLQLFIADPVPSFLGRGVNDHKNAEIRGILTPFLDVIRDANAAMVAITHLSKAIDPKRPASHRITGSIAYANLARSIHFVAKDPDNPARRLFMMAENTSAANNLSSVAFTLEPREVVSSSGEVFEIWVPQFEPATVDVDVNSVVNSDVRPRTGKPPGRKANQESISLAKWVLAYLRDARTPVRLGDLYNAAGDNDLLGEYGPQKDGKIRWSEGWKLTRAIPRVGKLEGDEAGWLIDEMIVDGIKCLQAVRAPETLIPNDSAKLQNHENEEAEHVPF